MNKAGQTFRIKCVEINQPIGSFYIGVMNHEDLVHISYADVRRLEKRLRDVEEYVGIERPLSPNRVKDIGNYVEMIDATFPTSVLLAVKSENVKFIKENGELEIEYRDNVAKVLDGQHRIAGLESYSGGSKDFQIIVAVFIDMELEDQAIVFATINREQTKVNKSLVADLFEFAKTRSPQKTAHNIARALNRKDGSPFKGKIKILGTAEEPDKETITQATFVESLLKYITEDKMSDRDLYKRGRKPDHVSAEKASKLIFRNLFIDEKDHIIANIVWNYFSSVSEKWPSAWKEVKRERILNRSTGFISLMRFLKDCYLHLNPDLSDEIISTDEFGRVFNNINLDDNDFTRDNYIPGSGGQKKLYNDLKTVSGI